MKIKKIEPLSRMMLKVTLDYQGREFVFAGDSWLLLWDLDNILSHWEKTVIPRILELESLSEEEFQKRIKKVAKEINEAKKLSGTSKLS